ncbi:MAG TPA: ATP-binding protein, partial [Nitrospiraceae bacterium]
MINTTLDKIDKAIIESLITNSVAESRTLEYKEALPGRSEKDNHEFLADVTAIANSSGGDLVYGIREKRDVDNKPTGEPQEACGIGQPNLDEEIRRLDNLLRTLVDPRISGILIRQIDGFPNGPVIIYRIQKSWAAPHMIRMSSRFYARTTREKYPMDVREIRAAFALSDALPDRIRRFRDDRLAKIVSDETPLPVMSGAKIAL